MVIPHCLDLAANYAGLHRVHSYISNDICIFKGIEHYLHLHLLTSNRTMARLNSAVLVLDHLDSR